MGSAVDLPASNTTFLFLPWSIENVRLPQKGLTVRWYRSLGQTLMSSIVLRNAMVMNPLSRHVDADNLFNSETMWEGEEFNVNSFISLSATIKLNEGDLLQC